MTPAFHNWNDFFAMGGYAFYVWLAVACTLLSLGALVLHTLIQRRKLLAEIAQRQARDRRIARAKMNKVAADATGESL